MLDMKGNTAAYLLYQLTRIRSVVRKVNSGGAVSSEEVEDVAKSHKFKLDHPKERKLAKTILKYHEILYQVIFVLRGITTIVDNNPGN